MLFIDMTSLDILYYSLSLCAFLLVGSFWYIAYHIGQNLKQTQKIVDDVADLTGEIQETKNFLKTGLRGMLGFTRNILLPKPDEVHGQTKRIRRSRKGNRKVQTL